MSCCSKKTKTKNTEKSEVTSNNLFHPKDGNVTSAIKRLNFLSILRIIFITLILNHPLFIADENVDSLFYKNN